MLKLDEYLETGVDKKLVLKCVKIYEEYFGSISGWREVKREMVHSLTGAEDFRCFLVKRVKNTKTRNRVIRVLEQVFDYLVMESVASGEEVVNPFIYDYDKEREFFKYGTTRERIPFWIMKEMIKEIKKDDFKFGRDQDFLSASLILWIMMIFPLRSVQARYLDSGLGDEFVYVDGEIIKNLNGINGRREGFIRKSFYSGVGRESYECLYVNTNKNGEGFEIPFCNQEILEVIERQVSWVKEMGFENVDKEYGKNRSKKVWLLFPDKNGKVVSKSKLDRLWKRFCEYMSEKLGVKLIEDGKCVYGLHCLRVSGVSYGVESGMNFQELGNYLSGQSSEIVLHYNQVGDLKSLVQGKEQKLLGSGKQILLIEGVKNESK